MEAECGVAERFMAEFLVVELHVSDEIAFV
jgi:hypothetical protein